MNSKQQKIESLLFYKNEPVSFSWLAKQLSLDTKDIQEEVYSMRDLYLDRGITLVITEDKVTLMTAEISQKMIEHLENSEDARDLSKQALETLAIILYNKKITKSELDYIRGVNSMFILRNLRMRGLIEKKVNVMDKRSPLYIATPELFAFLGIQSSDNLEYFEDAQEKLEEIQKQYQEEQAHDDL